MTADDLYLAVLLVESMDTMDTSVADYRETLRASGHPEIADGLTDRDLDGLKELRAMLRLLFSSATLEEAVTIVNQMLTRGEAVPQLVVEDDGRPTLRVAPYATGLAALQARLPAAAAEMIAAAPAR